MPNTKITKSIWKNHIQYTKWVYIIGLILVLAGVNLIYTVTAYRAPDSRTVLIQLVDSYADTTPLAPYAEAALADGQHFDETLENVAFYGLNYSGDAESDYYGSQKFMVETMAGENDLWFMSTELADSMISQGFAAPLDEFGAFNEFVSTHPEIDVLWADEYVEEGETPTGVKHAYAFSINNLTTMNMLNSFDCRNKYAFLSITSKNPETSFHVLCNLIDQLYAAPSPDSTNNDTEAAPSATAEVPEGA